MINSIFQRPFYPNFYLALERQIEALTVESRRGLISEKEKYEIKERSLHNKFSEVELELTRSRGELR